jgi:hypothetical protein
MIPFIYMYHKYFWYLQKREDKGTLDCCKGVVFSEKMGVPCCLLTTLRQIGMVAKRKLFGNLVVDEGC